MIQVEFHTGLQIPVVLSTGRLDGVTSLEFDQAIQPLLENHSCLIIDFSKCTYLSSAGIRVLLASEKRVLSAGGGLFLTCLSAEIFQVLEITGLQKVFQFFGSNLEALEEIERISQITGGAHEWRYGTNTLQFRQASQARKPALLWKGQGIAGYNELDISIGTGSAAETPEELEQSLGFFMTCHSCAGFIPNDSGLPPDFRIPWNPATAGIFVDQALSFGHEPAGMVRFAEPASLTISRLADAIYPLKLRLAPGHDNFMAMVTAGCDPVNPSISLCLVVDRELAVLLKKAGLEEIPGLTTAGEPGIRIWGAKFLLVTMPDTPADLSLLKFLRSALTIENVINVQFIRPGDLAVNPVSWVFACNGLEDASASRLKIETESDLVLEPSKLFLARRLYTDSARLTIKPLHGGYSAQTYQVESYDHQSRKMRPTVLKVAGRAIITRESERCRQYALPYILNNSAQVLGTEFFGNTGALRYNFVGIGGQKSHLKWLTHYYENWPLDQLIPLFDKIFLQILDPWYGQPIPSAIHPYRDHDPTATFFPGLVETAEDLFGLSASEQFVRIEETGRDMINPYWFLKHEFARRRDDGVDYLTSICHGDLNMQNILLDEQMNVYLIDFSETKPRSLISDFARLEAIFMIEHATMTNLDDIADYIGFLTQFYSDVSLGDPPAAGYRGFGQDQVAKNIAMTRKIREYAFNGVRSDPNPVPYCLAMLEWVLPVVCYQVPPVCKRYSMIIAGMLCEAVMRRD